jgi:Holliday junction DNA helicase RuvA
MYESVRGRLLEKDAGRCVVEAGGFGWGISIPLSTFDRLPRLGDEVALRLHLVQPERGGDWRLFGFSTEDERALFRACLKVAGVGPATAIALLSGMTTAALETAVASGDVTALTRIKGVGKKSAERLVVELRDSFVAVKPGAQVPHAGPVADAAAALTALGLDPTDVAERLRRIPGASGLPVSDLVRRALRTA